MIEKYATLGPSCTEQSVLVQMFREGMTGMRLNLSHTGLMDSRDLLKKFHAAAKEAGVEPQLLIDMQGPELRIGTLAEDVILQTGDAVTLVNAACMSSAIGYSEVYEGKTGIYEACEGTDDLCENGPFGHKNCKCDMHIPVPSEVINALEIGDEVLINDGKVALEVIGRKRLEEEMQENLRAMIREGTPNALHHSSEIMESNMDFSQNLILRVTRGGAVSSHKSIKIVGKDVPMPVLTAHDIANIRLANAFGVTGLMQPFVRSGEDLRLVRKELRRQHAEEIQIYAKIENRAAVANLAGILPEADVIVIARGDLGNDMPLWELPAVQKDIEEACVQAGKPFLVVTQMLASMEHSPVPTRAEVSDIFNAVADGAAGVMITGESAVGEYPVEAVRYLVHTANAAEVWKQAADKQ